MRLRGHRRQQKLKEEGDALTLWKMSILLHIHALVTVGGCKARKYHLLINITCQHHWLTHLTCTTVLKTKQIERF